MPGLAALAGRTGAPDRRPRRPPEVSPQSYSPNRLLSLGLPARVAKEALMELLSRHFRG